MSEQVVELPIAKVLDSTIPNYRKHLGKLDEMAASMRSAGVLEPLVVRPRGKQHELVFGYKRRAAAAKAGLETVPCIVRDYSDDQVLEVRIVENSQREDAHPMDEARGFEVLIERGYDVGKIAEKIGRSAAYVAQRLQLLKLCKDAREALDEGEITLAVAQLIARIPDTKLQVEALDDVLHESYDGPMKADAARAHIEERFMLRLSEAPFDVTDAALVPKAGACSSCKKRTGNQPELFADVKSADLCTDAVCFRAKKTALFQIRLKDAKRNGQEVLQGKAATAALAFGSRYRKLDAKEWIGNKQKTVRQLVAKAKPPITLAMDAQGDVHELVRQVDVEKVLPKEAKAESSAEQRWKADAKRREAKERQRAEAVGLAIKIALQKVDKLGSKLVPLLVRALIRSSWDDTCQAVVRSRGLEKQKKARGILRGAQAMLLAHADTLAGRDLEGLGLEFALRNVGPSRNSPANPEWGDALKALQIDFAELEKLVASQAKRKVAERSKKKAGKAAPKKRKDKS